MIADEPDLKRLGDDGKTTGGERKQLAEMRAGPAKGNAEEREVAEWAKKCWLGVESFGETIHGVEQGLRPGERLVGVAGGDCACRVAQAFLADADVGVDRDGFGWEDKSHRSQWSGELIGECRQKPLPLPAGVIVREFEFQGPPGGFIHGHTNNLLTPPNSAITPGRQAGFFKLTLAAGNCSLQRMTRASAKKSFLDTASHRIA